jgi:serine/threonine protein kinase
MSVTETTSRRDSPETQRCPQCNAVLPLYASFCGSCGERLEKPAASRQDDADVRNRYRITSLIRRRPYISLFFATDTHMRRTVVISDLDISSLDEEARPRAAQLVRREYDLLRRHAIPYLTPILQQEYQNGHIYVIAGSPFVSPLQGETGAPRGQLFTLESVLQSGIGLPPEQVAIGWIRDLCETVDRLHGHQVVIGELDPQALVMDRMDYQGHPALLLCWLPLYIRTLLPMLAPNARPFKPGPFGAPELQQGKVEARSDVYSLGALLYLLLTGMPPAAPAPHLRSPRELNPRVKPELDAVVMRALAFERSERFQSAASLAESLANPYVSTQVVRYSRSPAGSSQRNSPRPPERSRHQTSQEPPPGEEDHEGASPAGPSPQATQRSTPATEPGAVPGGPPLPAREPDIASLSTFMLARPRSESESLGEQARRLTQQLQKRITGLLPAIQDRLPLRPRWPGAAALPEPRSTALVKALPSESERLAEERSFLRQIQRFILGEQQRGTAAAAIIETPLRLRPGQRFSIRVRLMGRDRALPPPGSQPGARPVGLSALAHGDRVHIEVRSALYQRYAFVIQRAMITVPARGYIAEVTIPMPAPLKGKGGRRERLHIVFTDEQHRPLYEKAFAIEVLVSPLVRPGQEGHQALPIPY